MVRAPALLRSLGLVLAPAAFVTGCPGDDAPVDTADSSSSSSGDPSTSTTQTTTASTTQTTTVSTTDDTSSTSIDPDSSSSTDPTNATTESSGSESSGSSSESESTGADLCGNGVIDAGEDCEGADLGGMGCTDIGYDGGTLGCNVACLFDPFNCEIFVCGNGAIQGTEFCDADQVNGADCASEGFPLGGTLVCNAACDDYDISGCLTQLCGNDNIEGTETCDGSDVAGDTCAAHGFAGGNLGCNAGCTNITFGTCSPGNAQFTYIVNDTSPNSISAYAVDGDGLMTELPGSPFATGGNGGFDHHPDAVVSCGAYVYAANTTSGSIAGFFVEADGTLTTVPGSPFASSFAAGLSCNDGYLFATSFDDVVTRFSIAGDGSLASLGTVAASPATLGTTVDRESNRLFVAGNGDSINVYDIDGAGALAPVPGSPFVHGGDNHSAVVSPGGAFVASEASNGIRVWSVAGNGALSEIAGSPFADTSGCEVVGLAWQPDGERLFVGHRNCSPGVISVYDVAGNGALSQVAGSPFASGGDDTVGLAVSPSGGRLFATHLDSDVTSVFDVSDVGALVPVAGSPFANGVAGNHSWITVRGGGAHACQTPFGAPSYDEAFSFFDPPLLDGTRMTVAWDGVEYWASAGGFASTNLSELDEFGTQVNLYDPGFDIRSVFTKTDGSGPIYLRAYNDMQMYVQTSPGMFTTDVVLEGAVDSQSSVVFDDVNRYFLANEYGTVRRWDETGAYVDDIVLNGFGTMGTEGPFNIQGRGLAWSCGYFYTYSDQVLSAWDEGGNRIATTILNGAGTSGDSYYSYSIANGMFFVNDFFGGSWRGYDAV